MLLFDQKCGRAQFIEIEISMSLSSSALKSASDRRGETVRLKKVQIGPP